MVALNTNSYHIKGVVNIITLTDAAWVEWNNATYKWLSHAAFDAHGVAAVMAAQYPLEFRSYWTILHLRIYNVQIERSSVPVSYWN